MSDQAESTSDDSSDPPKKRFHRRKLLKGTLGCSAALLVGGGVYLKTRPRVRMAMIGAGMRGQQLASILTWMGRGWPIDVEVPYVIDPDRNKAAALAPAFGSRTVIAQDYREAINDDSVEAVAIVACDHWHAKMAIDAMQAGKAVYCEKPMAITYDEAWQMADVAESTGSVFQLGSQQRHHRTFRDFANLVFDDRLGEIELVEVLLQGNKYDSRAKWSSGETPPDHFDWNLWLGPTEQREYTPAAVPGWHEIFQFSGGSVLTWGAHHWDIGNWILETLYGQDWFDSCAIAAETTYPGPSELFDVPFGYRVEFNIQNRPRVIVSTVGKGESSGLRLTGTKGRAMVNRARVTGKPFEQLADQPLSSDHRTLDERSSAHYGKVASAYHLGDFLRCFVHGGTPISNAAASARTNDLLQLTNIACRQGQPLKWNQAMRRFDDNNAATAMLKRPWREV